MTILPLPLLMMNVNGKDTTEFITVQKVAAHKQSVPHTYPFRFIQLRHIYAQYS